MTKQTFTPKSNGDVLEASEWNALTSYVNNAVDSINALGSGGGTPVDSSSVVTVSSKGNVTLNSTKNVNIEPAWNNNTQNYSGNEGDIALKPGDDIQFCSHHRAFKKRDKIVVKNIDGSDNPVKALIVAGELELAVGTPNNPKTATKKKDKDTGADTNELMFKASDAKTLDVKILTGNTVDSGTAYERDERAYLKVRAQAIDLRCEKHGGIALQPKGYDSEGNMNKIKFEHGGGDGLEFGTFNTEKTSIFTDEYRFNRGGIWKMATRLTEASGKTIVDEGSVPSGKPNTGAYKYVKLADDFYDIINPDDELCTTKDIIKTAYALNGGKNRHAKVTNKGAIEIATEDTYSIIIEETPADVSSVVNIDTIAKTPAEFGTVTEGDIFNSGDFNSDSTPTDSTIYSNGTQYFSFTTIPAPAIKIESGGELKLGGVLDFGSSFNFGETDGGVEFQYKLTKKNNSKDCGIVKVVGVNNHSSNNLTVNDVTIKPGETGIIDLASMLDIISAGNAVGANSTCKVSFDYRFDVEELNSLDGDPDYEYTSSLTTPFFEDGKVYTLDDFELAVLSGYISITLKVGMINIINGTGNNYRTAAITYDGTVHYYRFTLNQYKEPSFEVKDWNSNNKVTFKDIVKLVSWMKANNEGPWTPTP